MLVRLTRLASAAALAVVGLAPASPASACDPELGNCTVQCLRSKTPRDILEGNLYCLH